MNYIWSRVKGTKGTKGTSSILFYIFISPIFPIFIYIFLYSALSALVPFYIRKPHIKRNNKDFSRALCFFYVPFLCPYVPFFQDSDPRGHLNSRLPENRRQTRGHIAKGAEIEKCLYILKNIASKEIFLKEKFRHY